MCDSFCQFEASPLITIHLILSPRPSVRPSIQLDQRDQMLVSRPSGEKKQSVSNSPRVSRSVGLPFSHPVSQSVSSSVSQSVSQSESHLVKPVRPVSHTFFQWYSRVWCPIRGEARIFQRGGHRGCSPDHHPGIADYIWLTPPLSLVYQRVQSYYRGMKAHSN